MFGIWPTLDSDMPPVNLVNNSIHRLDVKAYTNDFDCYTYNTEQCIQLARSSLGMQCVTLVIRVKTRENIFDLLNNMPNLQALIIRFHDDTWGDEDDTVVHKQDTLLDWLQDNLPSTCTIIRDTYLIGDIRIWIR
ncbi:hypothetical protein I4U23_001289 [Adineta vaga]|nr:hypothetical protein I4U23_001289 [Adineta vaga]